MTCAKKYLSLRGVMENTSHVLVVGEGAQRLANKLGVEEVEEDWLITDYARWRRDRVQQGLVTYVFLMPLLSRYILLSTYILPQVFSKEISRNHSTLKYHRIDNFGTGSFWTSG